MGEKCTSGVEGVSVRCGSDCVVEGDQRGKDTVQYKSLCNVQGLVHIVLETFYFTRS